MDVEFARDGNVSPTDAKARNLSAIQLERLGMISVAVLAQLELPAHQADADLGITSIESALTGID